MRSKTRLAAAAVIMMAAAAARAELSIERVRWQHAKPAKGAAGRVYEDVAELKTSPPLLTGRLRALLTLKNRGPRPVEGILLRYSAEARLADLRGGEPGVWSVPFMIEEKRVPRIGANQLVEVPLGPSPLLELYLRKVSRSGFWPDQLRLRAMLEPHRGAVERIALSEALLEVKR